MSRKRPLLGACAMLLLLEGCRERAAPSGPLHLLVVTLDTLRADRLGSYGYREGETPRLDALAAEGARFADVVSPVPLTLPSHASMFTGLFPMAHHVRDNGVHILSESHTTLAEILKSRGYDTAAFVSSFVLDSRFGLSQGFDLYHDFDQESGAPQKAMRGLSEVQRRGEDTARAALEWLSAPRPRPFFLWIHLYDPHTPFDPPEPYASRFSERPYDGEVAYTDRVVGTVLDRLEELGLDESTLVMVIGDHGESLGEHGEDYHSWFIYDATLKVPWIVRLPARIEPGLVVEQQVRLTDVAPTALEMLGVEAPEMQGASLASVLAGEDEDLGLTAYSESLVASLQFGWAELKAIRHGGYKLIEAPRPELYDLREDPHETRNLIGRRARTAREMRERLRAFEAEHQRLQEEGAGGRAALDEETIRKLQSLGYVASPSSATPGAPEVDPKDRIDVFRGFSAGLADAVDAIDRKEPRMAIEILAPLARELPEHRLVHYHLGQALLLAGDPESAASELELALALAPDFAQARADLAEAYVRLGRSPEAIEILTEGLAEQPNNPIFLFTLGFAHHADRRLAEAAAAYERALAIEPSFPQVLSNLAALAFQTGNLEAAASRLEEVVALAPSDAMAWNNLGLARVQGGRMEEAGEAFRKASELEPENPAFLRNLILWYQRAGRPDEARESIRRLGELESRPPRSN